MEQQRIEITWVPVKDLHCNPTNPRINEPAVPHVAASIKRFGFRQPIVAKPDGEVIAGNTRLKAASSMGLDEVPVVWFEGDETEAKAFAIADTVPLNSRPGICPHSMRSSRNSKRKTHLAEWVTQVMTSMI